MRKISPDLLDVLSNYVAEPMLLIKIGGTGYNMDMRFTSCSYDIEFNEEIYLANSSIVSIDIPKVSQVMDKENYKITLADHDKSYLPYLEQGITNIPLEVRAVFVDTRGGLNDGQLMLNDTAIIYKGLLNTGSYDLDYSSGTSALILTASSALASLDNISVFRVNPSYLKSVNPTDTTFDFVFDDKVTIDLKWGKY